ncbi:uncharacterized protein LOC106072324 isoform X3 [Biomphalaria glabrata]|uniref:RNA helicase n=1 Tax=Biomphalaria glabrata TaxID=6526 RepID=A0A9W3AUD3_BIOGL|nr:uncharacterized protein LOC106072324 isoform X3 [Biomphalaria glabrata]
MLHCNRKHNKRPSTLDSTDHQCAESEFALNQVKCTNTNHLIKMEKHIKKIQILKVIHPGNFLVKILTNEDEDAVTFSMFVREMTSCLNELQSIGITSYRPAEKDICAALGDDGIWYRVRLTSRVTDHSFMCSKIDDISEFLCNSHRLMTLPRKFLEYPQQVLKCCLWDVHPITMTMELGEKGYQAKQRACEEWDEAATHFMIDQISNSIGCRAEIMKEDCDSVLHLKLYFITTDEEIYFNQKLLEEGYAISLPDPSITFTDLPPLISESAETQQPLDRYQKLLNRNNSSSGQRDNCERVVMDTFRTFGNSPESSIKCTSTPRKFDISPQLPGSVRIQSLLDIGSPPALVRCELSPQHKVSVNGHFSTDKQVAGKGRGLASIFSEKTLDSPSYGQSRSTFVARPVSPQQQFDKGLNFLSEGESFITSNGHDKRDLLACDHDRSLLNPSHPELQFDTKHILQSSVSSSSSGEKSLTNIHSSSMSQQRSNFAPKLTSSEMQFGDRCTLNSSEKSSSLSNDQSVINLKVSDPNYCKSWVESSPIPESPSLDQTQRLQACSPSSSSSSSYLLSTTDTQYKSQGARPKQPKSSSNRLLEMLVKKHNGPQVSSSSSPSKEYPEQSVDLMTVRQDQPISRPFLGVVAHGIGLVPMAIDLADSHFHEDVKKVLIENFDLNTATGIMPFVWKASLGLRHVVGVSPSWMEMCLSYLPGLLTKLLDPLDYKDLPPGIGPRALILAPSCMKVRDISDKVEEFLTTFPSNVYQIRKIVLYAGGCEESEQVQTALLKGCDLLISTPSSMLRMLEANSTSCKRLCHVILDDANILSARYPTQVEDIMTRFKLVFSEREKKTIPAQIMIFAKEWDQNMNLFVKKYTLEPYIVISSKLEAAVYGDVHQVVLMSLSTKKLMTFCSVIDNLTSTLERVVTFTSDLSEAIELSKAAKSRGAYCLLIHEDLSFDEKNEAREQWLRSSHSKQFLVLVCTDQCYEDLAITNATRVIHYGLPNSKTKFGNRLACMLDYFRDRTSAKEPALQPISQIIVTEEFPDRAVSLKGILDRCGSEKNIKFDNFIAGHLSNLEKDPDKELCPFLKSFGKCVYPTTCKCRHILLPDQDSKSGLHCHNTLPSSGEIKIKIINVKNTSRYYCHLVEHRSYLDAVRTDLRIQYQKLVLDMLMYYSKESNHAPFVPDTFSDELCTLQDKDQNYYRVKVLEIDLKSRYRHQYKVWLVDDGREEKVTLDQLMKLPQELAEIPFQAVEVILCNIKPMDDDFEWTVEADTFVDELINGKQLIGQIMMSMGSTLWLSPLVHQIQVDGVGAVNDVSIRSSLKEKHFAQTNPEHMKSLYGMCRGQLQIPEHLLVRYFDYCLQCELKQEVLTSECTPVALAFVDTPSNFYVQRWETLDQLSELEEQMEETKSQWIKSESSKETFHLEVGSVCLVQSTDNQWYRCTVTAQCHVDLWEVFMLDYGDCEQVSRERLRPMPRYLAHLPCQAIHCRLAYVEPIETSWSSTARDILCDIAYYLNETKKKLFIKVIDSSMTGSAINYAVDLYSTNYKDTSLCEELVWRRQAVCTGQDIEPLFASPDEQSMESFVDILDNVPYFCARLYLGQGDVGLQSLELENILSYRHPGWDSSIEESCVIANLVKCIGYISNVDAHGKVVSSLTACCRDSEILCEMALEENLEFHLIYCLEQVSQPDIQCQTAEALASLVTVSRFLEHILQTGLLIETLLHFFERCSNKTVDTKIIKLLSQAATLIIETAPADSLSEKLMTPDLMQLLCCQIRMSEGESSQEPWFQLLAAVSTQAHSQGDNHGLLSVLMRKVHLDMLLQLLTQLSNVKCQYYLLKVFQQLVLVSRKYKLKLQTKNLFLMLDNLLDKDLESPAVEVCRELRSELNLKLPKPEALSGLPVQKCTDQQKIVSPEVRWSQTCSSLLLKFIVKQAQPQDFTITEDKIVCRVETEDTLYSLDWDLYGQLIPQRSNIVTQKSIAYVKLVKRDKGRWSRLLKSKKKPPTLIIDFDQIQNSDEEDDELDDPNQITFQQPKTSGFTEKLSVDVHERRPSLSSESESDDVSSNEFSDHEFEYDSSS